MVVEQENEQHTEIEDSVNTVGTKKSSKVVFVVILGLLAVLVYYFMSSKDSKDVTKDKKETVKVEDLNKLASESAPVAREVAPPVSMPTQLPELPALVAPSVPVNTKPVKLPVLELPQPSPALPPLPNASKPVLPAPPSPSSNSSFSGYSKERRGSSMLVISSKSSNMGLDANGKPVPAKDGDALPDSAPLQKTAATSSRATKMGNLNYTIAQGKMLDAVLETAINSDLKGSLRAVVSRDIYAESGINVLIPKGSRLIGQYSFDGTEGHSRVDVTWNRVIMPYGVDIAIDSLGVDELGRNGLSGIIDDKIPNILMTSLMIAGISAGTAIAAGQIPGVGDQVYSKVTDPNDPNYGKETSTVSLTYDVLSKAINDLSDSMKGVVKKYEDTKSTIYVDQGTMIKVFVAKDLIFPPDSIPNMQFIN